MNGRLQGVVSALFAERTPSTCPTDPGLKQHHLRALTLLALTLGGGLADTRRPAGSTPDDDHSGDTNDANATDDDDVCHPGQDSAAPSNQATSDDEWANLFHGGPSRFGRPEIVIVLDARQQTIDTNNGNAVIDRAHPRRTPTNNPRRTLPPRRHPTRHHRQRHRHTRAGRNEPRTHHPPRLASPTTRTMSHVPDLRPTRLRSRVHLHQTSPRRLLGTRRTHQPRQPASTLQQTPPLRPRRRMATHPPTDRTLTITHPDHTIRTTGPPLRLQAA